MNVGFRGIVLGNGLDVVDKDTRKSNGIRRTIAECLNYQRNLEVKMEEKQLIELEKGKKGILEKVSQIEIVSHETLKEAVDFTQQIKVQKKKFEDLRKYLIGPSQKFIKETNARFKAYTNDLDQAEEELRVKMTKYSDEQEKKRRDEEDRIRKEQEKKYKEELKEAKKEHKVPSPPPAPIHVETEKVEGLQMRKQWTFRIVDEKKIPREYLTPDVKKIRKVVQAGIRKITGIEIYQESISAIGSKKEDDIKDL